MEFQPQIISKELIKPSSPTPEMLREYKLSLFDQFQRPDFMPMIYLYLPSDDNDQANITKSIHLKKSLSESLKLYYPLAGRLVGGRYVECIDQGVPFIEAKADCRIDEFVDNPIPREFNKLVSSEIDEPSDIVLYVQLTYFQCGGVSIGIRMNHKIADAASLFSFVNSWAGVASGKSDLDRPIYQAADIFSPVEKPPEFGPGTEIKHEDIVAKVFTFSSFKIADLQDRYSSSGHGRRPSKVEALSAFIWTRFYSATETHPNPAKIYTVSTAVNLRARFDPPLPNNLFGNISRLAPSMIPAENCGDVGDIMNKLRETIRGQNGAEYVNQLGSNNHRDILKKKLELIKSGGLVMIFFTSLCRFPWREADFGWGKPVRIGSISTKFKNLVTLFDSARGDGIDAWINMKKVDMDKFENDAELRTLLS